jgi:nucleotide-binding universal stress UspA family protein
MKRILVAVDGSQAAARAAQVAADLAAVAGAELELVHVYDVTSAMSLGMRALDKDELAARGREIAHGPLDAARAAISASVPIATHVAFGHPAEQVLLRAKETGADMLVVGSRGLGPFESAVLGSVSHKVLALADRPVLVVH